ncbi:Phospholipase_D-nuclease N-terminal [Methylobacillus rhizosphaerae]|uniref:Phospholipase_D-nuclease N-terminal n=1 Tax=Methylobacillus rhizosphaerae TaxID=551994 RepID=A0A239AWV2_9PROT|nr:PLD nuclease N-terminal domain-containing protein [Methylobacillus rhizosphaerae]SNR99443.1 Phospholipase_D-nuclease N-terminal [Methylobacillus rhizosphaerae]
MQNQSIIALLIFVADIYAIIKILQSSADTVKKILWILGVLIFPVVGLIVWYFAGPGSKTN